MIVMSYGGGTDSTGLLLAAHARGIRPDLIIFADTGSERPETYAYLDTIDGWLASVGWPRLQVVRWIRKDGTFLPLHEWCERHSTLPSKAFGLAGCTSKWKQQPLDAAAAAHPLVQAAHRAGEVVERWVGFDANEGGRAARLRERPDPHLWRWRAPLIDWDLDRADCKALIVSAGLPQPGKSACWLCPQASPAEVMELREQHPALLERALAIEEKAKDTTTTVLGLGRAWRWKDAAAQMGLPFRRDETPCGCHDRRQAPTHRSRPYAPRVARMDPYRSLLGLVPDAELARRAGVRPSTVTQMRARTEGRPWVSLLR